MKKLDWFILIIIIAAIVAIGIWAVLSASEDDGKKEEKSETRLDCLTNRLKAIQQQILKEIESLKTTVEMEQFLERKIVSIFLLAKTTFLALFSGVIYLFIYNGSGFLTALFNTIGIASFIAVAVPFLFLSKVLDVNSLIEFIRGKIRKWIYIKYGYNPALVTVLKESIESRTIAARELEREMKSLRV